MAEDLTSILNYTPIYLQQQLTLQKTTSLSPHSQTLHGTILFCDIAGFSKMTEEISRESEFGIAKLGEILDIYIGRLVDIILEHGGDIVKFAGDALFAFWPKPQKVSLADPSWLAMQCALHLKRTMNDFMIHNMSISIRLGIGAGAITTYQVGGVYDRWELLFTGPAMNQANRAGAAAKAGQLVITPEIFEILHQKGLISKNGSSIQMTEHPDSQLLLSLMKSPPPPSRLDSALRAYIPRAILSRIDAGVEPHLVDLRPLSVIFLKITTFRSKTDNDLAEVQQLMTLMQESIYEFEGSINRFGFDDKGAVLLAAFGLPPLVHEDDEYRAVMATCKLISKLNEAGHQCVAGITTGTAFCGTVGSPRRSEYTMHGTIVNQAAALMQNSKNILCDETTAKNAGKKLRFKTLTPIKVKGRDEPFPVYAPEE